MSTTLLLAALLAACSGSEAPDNDDGSARAPADEPGAARPGRPGPAARRPGDKPRGADLSAPPVSDPADAALPDVVVLTLDTTRADHLPTYGYFRDTAPTLDALAKESVVFDRFVVPMATTLPTHTSLLTGTYPTEHGIQANVQHGGEAFVPGQGLKSLAQWLDGQGYQTGGFVSAAPLARRSGIAAGFQVYTQPAREQRRGAQTADDALAWLDSTASDVPLLMWVHFYDPHNPFNPPKAYRGLFEADAELDAWIAERQLTPTTTRPNGETLEVRSSIDLYDAEIRYMDDQVARLLEGLQARGRTDNTLFIVAGDHGEGLNQHGEPGHGLVWHEQLHAPLFVKAPGLAPGRVSHTVSAVDVLPTALGRVELPGEETVLAQSSGVDALADDFTPRPVLSQTSARQKRFGVDLTYTLTDDAWKCRWTDGEPAVLWHMADDPFELSPVDDPARAEACEQAIREMLDTHAARAEALGSGQTRKVSDEELEQLRALGYVDDAPEDAAPEDAAPEGSP